MKHAEVLPPPSEYDGEITDAGRHTTYEVERDCTSKFKRTSVLSTAWEQGWRHTTLKVKASAALIARTHTIKTNDACERARIGWVRMGDDGTRPCMRWPSPSHSVAATVMSNPDNEYLMGLATVVVFLTVALPGRQGTFVRCDRAGRTRLQTSTYISHAQVYRADWLISRLVDSSQGGLHPAEGGANPREAGPKTHRTFNFGVESDVVKTVASFIPDSLQYSFAVCYLSLFLQRTFRSKSL